MYTVAAFTTGNARMQALFLGHLVCALPVGQLGAAGSSAGSSAGSATPLAFSPYLCSGAAAPHACSGVALGPPSAGLPPAPLAGLVPALGAGGAVAAPALSPSPSTPGAGPTPAQLSDARLVRAWVNSLGLQGCILPPYAFSPRAIARACADGVLLLRLLDVVEPGAVAWGIGSVYTRPTAPSQARGNAESALAIARAMDLPGAGKLTPGDITSGCNVGGVLGLLVSCARAHVLARISRSAFGGSSIDEAAVLAWANELVEGAAAASGAAAAEGGGAPYFASFSALSIARGGGVVLGLLLAGLGCAVDWECAAGRGGETALYLISCAARAGAYVLPTAQELLDGAPRPCAFLLLSLLAAATA